MFERYSNVSRTVFANLENERYICACNGFGVPDAGCIPASKIPARYFFMPFNMRGESEIP